MGSQRPSKKPSSAKSRPKSSSKPTSKSTSKTSAKKGPKPKAIEQKTRRTTVQKKQTPLRNKYSLSQLDIPSLNGIIPASAKAPDGKSKGGLGKMRNKVFVDDADHMLAILGAVQAEKEGEREGKMMKARQLEEMREEKRIQAEKKQTAKKEKFQSVVDEVKQEKKDKKRRRNGRLDDHVKVEGKKKKKVTFV